MKCFLCGWHITKGRQQNITQGTVEVCTNRRMCLIRYLASALYADLMPVYDRAIDDKAEQQEADAVQEIEVGG